MRKYKVYFLEGNASVNVTSEDVEAHSFITITVPSRVASSTVVFNDRYGRELYMFTHVVKVEYKGESK